MKYLNKVHIKEAQPQENKSDQNNEHPVEHTESNITFHQSIINEMPKSPSPLFEQELLTTLEQEPVV